MNNQEKKVIVDFYENREKMQKDFQDELIANTDVSQPLLNYGYRCGCGESPALYLEDEDFEYVHIYVHCEACAGEDGMEREIITKN